MSNFNSVDGDLDRVFFKEHELYDKFFGTQLWGWGANLLYGAVGDNSTVNKSSPVTVSGGGTNWKHVSNGKLHSLAIKTDGTLWAWGMNDAGQLGNNTVSDKSSPVTVSGGGTTWKQISAGGKHNTTIKSDGTLWTWGSNLFGELGISSTISRSSPGTISGNNNNWQQCSCNYYCSAAIKTDGTLWTWGYNTKGQLGDNSVTNKSSPVIVSGGGTNWKQISCGYQVMGAIKTDGTLWTWGTNNYNALGQGVNGGPSKSSPVTIAGGGTTWQSVSIAHYYGAAIKTDKTLWVWGSNQSGQLGTVSSNSQSSPVTVSGGGTTWKQISSASYFMAAIKTDGTLWTWGNNGNGELANNSTVNTSSPGRISGEGTNWKMVSGNHAIRM